MDIASAQHTAPLIIEFTPSYLRVGIAGESQPRHILPCCMLMEYPVVSSSSSLSSEYKILQPTLPRTAYPIQSSLSLPSEVGTTDTTRSTSVPKSVPQWSGILYPLFANLYTQILLLKPKSRRVILLLSSLTHQHSPTFLQALSNILLHHLHVPSLLIVKSAPFRTVLPYALGCKVGMIVNITQEYEGYVNCIVDGFPLDDYGRTLHVVPVGLFSLLEMMLNRLKVDERICICSHTSQDNMQQKGETNKGVQSSGVLEESLDIRWCQDIIEFYCLSKKSHRSIPTPTLQLVPNKTTTTTTTTAKSLHQILKDILNECIHEIYYNPNNPSSLIYAFLSSLKSCPMDLKAQVIRNVAFIGDGIGMIPTTSTTTNLHVEFVKQLVNLFTTPPLSNKTTSSKLLSSKFSSLGTVICKKGPVGIIHPLPFCPKTICWVGGSVMGSLPIVLEKESWLTTSSSSSVAVGLGVGVAGM